MISFNKIFADFDNLRFWLLEDSKNHQHYRQLLEAKKLGNLAIGLII